MATRRRLVRVPIKSTTSCCPHCGSPATVHVYESGAMGTYCGCRWWRFEGPDGSFEEEDERFLEWLHGGDDPLERLDRPMPSGASLPEALPSWDEIVEYRPAS